MRALHSEASLCPPAAALNFKDVMLAYGKLNRDLMAGGYSRAALGFEFCRHAAAAGPPTPRRVMGVAHQAIATSVGAPKYLVRRSWSSRMHACATSRSHMCTCSQDLGSLHAARPSCPRHWLPHAAAQKRVHAHVLAALPQLLLAQRLPAGRQHELQASAMIACSRYRHVTGCYKRLALHPMALRSQVWDVPAGVEPEGRGDGAGGVPDGLLRLVMRGGMRKGQRVLVHSGTGAVGLAAIRIAHFRGCEVRASAASHLPWLLCLHVLQSSWLLMRTVHAAQWHAVLHVILRAACSCRLSACHSMLGCMHTKLLASMPVQAVHSSTVSCDMLSMLRAAGVHDVRLGRQARVPAGRRSPGWTTPTSATRAPPPSRPPCSRAGAPLPAACCRAALSTVSASNDSMVCKHAMLDCMC